MRQSSKFKAQEKLQGLHSSTGSQLRATHRYVWSLELENSFEL